MPSAGVFTHHSNRKEQERLAEMMRNPGPSIRIKVNIEKLKDQLICELTMPVFAPQKGMACRVRNKEEWTKHRYKEGYG